MNANFVNPQTTENKRGVPLGSIARISSHAQTPQHDKIIQRFALQNASRRLLPSHRVSNCLRSIIPTQSSVNIMHDAKNQRAYYQNLRTCNSVWDCPVCAAKITERRKVELQKAVTYAHNELGLYAVLATFTIAHGKRDALADTLKRVKQAFQRSFSGRWYQDFKAKFGLRGFVRAFEVTYGQHGFHPHLHVLMFFDTMTNENSKTMKHAMQLRYHDQLVKIGGNGVLGIECDLKDANTAIYDYIAKFGHEPAQNKWNVEHEVTKAPNKSASADGLTPFGLLESYANGNAAHGEAFKEYAECFKGKHQLQWSKGLKELLCVTEEKSDNALDEHQKLAELSRREWYDFLRLSRDLRGELLAFAACGNATEVEQAIRIALKFGFIPQRATRTIQPEIVAVADAKPRSENPFVWYARQQAKANAHATIENGVSATRHAYVQ